MAPGDPHECPFRDEAQQLRGELDDLKHRFAVLERQYLGKKSEKMPPLERQLRKDKPAAAKAAEAQARRRERAEAKEQLVTEVVEQRVPDAERRCPHCANEKLKSVGDGKPRVIFEYVPAYFRRRIYRRETLACTCGQYLVTGPCPEHITEKTKYAPSFTAHLIVSKCADSIPLYRLEKHYGRIGIPVARSTMTDLFHRAAVELAPLWQRLLARIASSEIVFADETTLKMQSEGKRAFVWTFLAENLIGYRFSPTRSGETPRAMLAGTQGTLVVDAYTGYNAVTTVAGRTRAGCLAHARRKVFDAKEDPAAAAALELFRDIYVVEHDAKEQGIQGSEKHLALRKERTRPLLVRLLCWARAQKRIHPPKSKMGRAARYILNNHRPLTRFVFDARLPPDNNKAEAALRRVALGRKNFLFVGHEDAGENLAALYSLVATCEMCGVNPIAYLSDVLSRVATHPMRDIDALLPDRWKPAAAAHP